VSSDSPLRPASSFHPLPPAPESSRAGPLPHPALTTEHVPLGNRGRKDPDDRPRRRAEAGWRPLTAVLTLGLLQLAGCSMTPAYQRPQLQLPASFASDAGVEKQAAALPSADQWWRSYDSPELLRLIEQSLSNNNDIQAAAARVEEARATARISSAALFPAASLQGSVVATRGGSLGDYRLSNSSVDVLPQLTYELDLFGRLHAQARSARALAAASDFDADTIKLSLTSEVAATYFTCLSLEDRLRAARDMAAEGRRILELTVQRRAAGTASDIEVGLQQDAFTNASTFAETLAEQYEKAQHRLAVLIGKPSVDLAAQGLSYIRRPQVSPGLPSSLLGRRPDIRAAEARLTPPTSTLAPRARHSSPRFRSPPKGGWRADRSPMP